MRAYVRSCVRACVRDGLTAVMGEMRERRGKGGGGGGRGGGVRQYRIQCECARLFLWRRYNIIVITLIHLRAVCS